MTPAQQRAAAIDSFIMLFGKHLLLVMAVFSLWVAANNWYSATGLPLASALSVVNGLVAGFLITGVVHEWSHLGGAWAFASRFTFNRNGGLFIFDFDLHNNSKQQFLAMSLGGNIGGWLFVFILPQLLPLDNPGARMLHAGTIAAALFAAVIEVPVMQQVQAGKSPADALGGISRAKLYRAGLIGVGAGIAYWILYAL